ncbi:MAG: NADPH-dependent 7-cyano-7-deazaguanine reductase QueF [Chlamydia sp. 32-24]|nr:MAG: NADPH-dependent 7-cyano-7-deazaguanine reductase QueF [Chlamydia sp. 32-24]
MNTVELSPLGQKTVYIQTYSPEQLYPVPRSLARKKTNIPESLPFHGIDIWNGYELSWLNKKGKPQFALCTFIFSCTSPTIVESKSLKLYLNSFNQSIFVSANEVQTIIKKDLSLATNSDVEVHIFPHTDLINTSLKDFDGQCVDHLDIETSCYSVTPSFLTTQDECVQEKIYTHLLKSNCLATGQPDWGSIFLHYKGPKINQESFLKYIISYRNHSGFAEHCIEQIYCDILHYCKPELLTVYGCYTRRGGLDINPFRSNFEQRPNLFRHVRQ